MVRTREGGVIGCGRRKRHSRAPGSGAAGAGVGEGGWAPLANDGETVQNFARL